MKEFKLTKILAYLQGIDIFNWNKKEKQTQKQSNNEKEKIASHSINKYMMNINIQDEYLVSKRMQEVRIDLSPHIYKDKETNEQVFNYEYITPTCIKIEMMLVSYKNKKERDNPTKYTFFIKR